MSNVKSIRNSIKKANGYKLKFEGQCDHTLYLFMKNLKFDPWAQKVIFYVEYMPGDGFVLADNNANVYDLHSILKSIEENGPIKELSELNQFKI